MGLYDMLFKSRDQRMAEHRAELDRPKAKPAKTAGAPTAKRKKRKTRSIGEVIRGRARSVDIDDRVSRMARGR